MKGATFFYMAMFDEVQEGTAIYKFAANSKESCQGAKWLTADIDGVKVPGDHYLTMAGHFTSDAKNRKSDEALDVNKLQAIDVSTFVV